MRTSSRPPSARAVLLAGILPVVIFTVIEEVYGTLWGLVAGMAFGIGEISYEWFKYRRVEAITWLGNGLLLGMGVIALVTQEGVWFKLQPAIMEGFMAVLLMGTSIGRRPLLVSLAEKQGVFEKMPEPLRDTFRAGLNGINFRLGVFFLVHTVLAIQAALHWSTRNWALLKGVGLTLSLLVYLATEFLLLRRRFRVS